MRGPVLLATRSPGKLKELRPLFSAAGFEVLSVEDAGIAESEMEERVEEFETFQENALAKARYFYGLIGGMVVADDSGLVVEVLGGAPGVKSKRWSGEEGLRGLALDEANNRKLLSLLRGVSNRRARYVCAAALVDGSGEVVRVGETCGEIVDERRGTGGFGYDPYFLSEELGVTFGEATREAKEEVSHRGRAFRALIEVMVER